MPKVTLPLPTQPNVCLQMALIISFYAVYVGRKNFLIVDRERDQMIFKWMRNDCSGHAIIPVSLP